MNDIYTLTMVKIMTSGTVIVDTKLFEDNNTASDELVKEMKRIRRRCAIKASSLSNKGDKLDLSDTEGNRYIVALGYKEVNKEVR